MLFCGLEILHSPSLNLKQHTEFNSRKGIGVFLQVKLLSYRRASIEQSIISWNTSRHKIKATLYLQELQAACQVSLQVQPQKVVIDPFQS